MQPPNWLCRALYRIHPQLRLAWRGRDKTPEEVAGDVTDCGSFCLVQLFPANTVGDLSDPNVYSELWDVSPRVTPRGVEMVKLDRGPIFAKDGRPRRDWDPLFEVPIFLIDLEAFGFGREKVLDGTFLVSLPRWMTPAKKRMKASLEERYKDHKREVKDLAGEAGDFLWHKANQTGATSPTVTWADAKEDVTNMYEKREHRKLESYYSIKDKL